ncbi:MAG: glycosyl hydrolase family 57 [Clostridia bacterium]|nr:glycosyl hydrolase family 57 [Clostridia bacterium]
MSADNKIHVAFGFHVNCYHSYRGDTNDGLGFGSDIRIIRKIIDVLNKFNEEGIPVKGTWDSENFFSLEKILPEYAPDIIEGMKDRVKKYGDENIIMGYSNGALSAMTEDEFTASVNLAVTNPQGSGLKDIFGECEMIVRPQEVMFTPSQVSLYNKCGVKALCLYYSCVPFDAFRTVIPALSDELAFNPLTYTYKGESLTIIPTYNNSDICDAGCLRKWVKELRAKQVSGEINRDMLMFINMDADAIFWETMNLPVIGSKLANTDGIHGLVKEIADLDYVVFDTPGGYLKSHEAVGSVSFTQDTADGNFTGYASWSEKPYNRKIWTAIERARAMSKVTSDSDGTSPSFRDRVLLLSTTHFGLATPVLNIQRETKANALADSIVSLERSALPVSEKLTVHNITGSTLQCLQLRVNGKYSADEIQLSADGLVNYTLIPVDEEWGTVFAVMRFDKVSDAYEITASIGKKRPAFKGLDLKAGSSVIRFSPSGIREVLFNGRKIGGRDFLQSFITYGKKKYLFNILEVSPVPCGGTGKCIRMKGKINLPGEASTGKFIYDFFTLDGVDMVFVTTDITYPYTPEADSISTENSTLGRYTDMKWTETAPFELTPDMKDDVSVIKRNFMGDVSSFRTASFGEADEKNKSLSSFNHQLTGGFTGLVCDGYGIILANSRQVGNSMAHCPMRLEENGTVRMNPFGTYYGPQRHHWGRGKDEILNVYTLVTPQGKSIAPAYNGVTERNVMALCMFEGSIPVDDYLKEITAFSDGAVANASEDSLLTPYYGDNVSFPETKATGETGSNLRNPILNGIKGNLGKYVTGGTKAVLHILKNQLNSK